MPGEYRRSEVNLPELKLTDYERALSENTNAAILI